MTDTTATPRITTMRDLLDLLSDDAWQKPPQGIDPALRKAAFSNGWLEATGHTTARQWHITPEGVEELARLRSGQPSASDDPLDDMINLDDPALLDDRTEEKRWKGIVDEKQRKINELNKTLDDMGKVADDLQQKLKAATEGGEAASTESITTGINWYEAVVLPLIGMIHIRNGMMDLSSNSDFSAETVHNDPSQITRYVAVLCESLTNESAIVDGINALAAEAGKGHMDPRDFVEELWARVKAAERDRATLKVIIETVCDLMDKDGGNQPIPAYLTDLHKKAQLSDQHAATIESLRRCVEELKLDALEHAGRLKHARETLFAAEILNELCDLLPEVAAYRTARESAVQAIHSLTAKR